MSFPILQDYEARFPECKETLQSLTPLYAKKLWNELTMACLRLIFHPSAKGKITFAFYNDFVKKFQKQIDQVNLLKLIRQSLISLPSKEILQFLDNFQKDTATEEIKMLAISFRGFFSISVDSHASSDAITKVKAYIDNHKDVDSYLFSSYYKLCYTFYASKRRYKLFYSSALQYLAYTQAEQIEEKQKLDLLFDMAVAVLVSEEIYNFSELLEQPLLVSLKNSQHSWLYQLIQVFNKGDISKYAAASLQHDVLKKNSKGLEQKIRLMAFLELAFNLPKNNRVITFSQLSKTCGIPLAHVEFMVMKAMALKLVRGSINQISEEVTIGWVAPKVLENDRIATMLGKFQQWEDGVKGVQQLISRIRV